MLVDFHDVRRIDRLGRDFDRLINLPPFAPAPASETVERSVGGCLVQPRRGEIGVGRMPAVKGDENLLDDVFRLSTIDEDAIGDPDAPRVFGTEQRLESIALSFHEANTTRVNCSSEIHAHHFLSTGEQEFVTRASGNTFQSMLALPGRAGLSRPRLCTFQATAKRR